MEIFISHGWDWSEHFSMVLKWLSSCRDLNWQNGSFPCHGGMDDASPQSLKRAITNQIKSADIVLILGGMYPLGLGLGQYADHRKWIEHEIQEARRLNKKIIGVKPWDGSPIPAIIREASICDPIDWNAKSLVEAVKRHGSPDKPAQRQFSSRGSVSRMSDQCA